jgi:hypothetical protein
MGMISSDNGDYLDPSQKYENNYLQIIQNIF